MTVQLVYTLSGIINYVCHGTVVDVADFDDGESWNDTVTEDDWQKVFLKAKHQENHLKNSAGKPLLL